MSISFSLYLPSTNVEGDDDPLRDWFTDEGGWFKNVLLPLTNYVDPHVKPLLGEKSLTEDCEGDAQSEAPGLDIGTHVYGWVFLLTTHTDRGIHDLDDWERLWSRPGAEIRADNGDILTPEEMRAFIVGPRLSLELTELPVIDDDAPNVEVKRCGRKYNWVGSIPPERCRLMHFEMVYGRNARPTADRRLLTPADPVFHPGKFGNTYVLFDNVLFAEDDDY